VNIVAEPLVLCSACRTALWADNVFKTVAVPSMPDRVAALVRCPQCDTVNKLTIAYQELDEALDDAEDRKADIELAMREAEIMLDQPIDAEYLQSYWRSWRWPPKIERGRRRKRG
jgi:hypothetical protein